MMDIETTKLFLAISIFVLMVFSLAVSIRYGRVNKWTYIMIPFILFLTITLKTNFETILGYPTTKPGDKDQLFITHMVGIESKWIYIWAIDSKISWEPRSYKIPYTKETEKKLNEAKDKQGDGFPMMITLEPPPVGGGNRNDYYTVDIRVFDKFTGQSKPIQNGVNDER